MRKKVASFISALAIMVTGILTVYAVGVCVAVTSLRISTGSTLTGSKYSMPYNTQSIEFDWTEIGYTNSSDPYMNVTLYKKGLIFYSSYQTNKLTVKAGTPSSTLTYSNAGSGSYYWYFETGTSAKPTGYFSANPVYINSES